MLSILVPMILVTMAGLPYEKAKDVANKNETSFVVEVGATWCGPCQILKRNLNKVFPNYGSVDFDEEPALARKLLRGDTIPQLIIYKNIDGKWLEQKRFIGMVLDENQIREAVK
jgi:thioredoxin-like negative regulator of GroEL